MQSLTLDLDSIMEAVSNDMDFFLKLVQAFFDGYQNRIEEMKQFIEKNESSALKISAHTIKSSLGSIGAQEANRIAFELEKLAGTGDLKMAGEVFERLTNEVSRFKEEVSKLSCTKD